MFEPGTGLQRHSPRPQVDDKIFIGNSVETSFVQICWVFKKIVAIDKLRIKIKQVVIDF